MSRTTTGIALAVSVARTQLLPGLSCVPADRAGPSRWWWRVYWLCQYLQLKELGGLIQSAVVAGEENSLFSVDVEFMCRCELHAVVSPKGKDVGKAPSTFHYWLTDFDNGEGLPELDQVLPGLFEILVADRVFSLEAGEGRHRFGPTDPADPNGINSAADLPHLFRLSFVNQQLHQGAGVAEEDHQLNPDPQSRCR